MTKRLTSRQSVTVASETEVEEIVASFEEKYLVVRENDTIQLEDFDTAQE